MNCQLFLVLLVTLISSSLSAPPSSLKLVNLLYRHGDRSPAAPIFPTDKHQVENSWPDGLGWLTNIGKVQQYKLGQWLSKRYNGFMNTTRYNHEEISVEASGIQRCLMSAYSNLAGFFPPTGNQTWNKQLKWQPIPVQTRPVTNDNKLAMSAKCPKYDVLLTEAFKSPEATKIAEDYKDFFKEVTNQTGLEVSLSNVWQVADDLICEKAHNLTWNPWFKEPGVWENLTLVFNFGFDLLFDTTQMAKLKGGPLLKEMISNMDKAVPQSNPMPHMYMYSAHDTTVTALLRAMKVFNFEQPPYASLVLVEMHHNDDNNTDYVKIFYRNDTNHEPYELFTPGCEDPCLLSTFKSVLKDSVPTNWTQECMVDNGTPNRSRSATSITPASWIALAVTVLLCLAIVGLAIQLVLKQRNREIVYSRI